MALGMCRAKKRGMDPQDVKEFMEECSRLLDEGQPRRSTPNSRPSVSRPDEDETFHKGTSEIDELRHLLHMQRLEMAELREELAHRSTVTSDVDKVFLGTFTPMEYDGEGDFEDYLSQLEAIGRTPRQKGFSFVWQSQR